jgi:ribosomal protein S18 acetylase RimI-like enzyme/predicted nucleic acid-binding protein
MVEIVAIDEGSPHLEKVIELAQANIATLGFFPKGAFVGYAARKQILVALDDEKNVLGYLLYATSPKKMLAYIVHLCVETSQRRRGIATALFDELKKATKDSFSGIRVRCRRDYGLSGFWSRLGFAAVGERPGRSKRGTTLTVWRFDHELPTLFTFADERRTQSKLRVAIDANVFYDLEEPPTPENEESQSLLADWLEENIELCLTSEIFNEIDRNRDKTERERKRAFARQFRMLPSPDDKFQKISEDLRGFFPRQMDERDASDVRQLARAIAADVQFFVTRDGLLLKIAEQIYEGFGMRIIRPSDLIIHQDALIREAEYQPARLAGSSIKIERIHPGQSSLLEETFRAPQEETKAEFRQRLQPCLADPHIFETNVIQRAKQPLALIVYGRQTEHELEIPLFRILQDSLSATLARYLVLNIILVSSGEGRTLTRITDARLSDDVIDALQENGFIFTNGIWIKASLPVVETAEELASRLASLSNHFPQTSQYFQEMINLVNTAHSAGNIQMLLKAERSLWPAKITDIDIPAFVVPIWPEWAMHLFDPHIASQDLFGAEPNLIFRVENVYYRTSHRKVLSAPARILWYVSKGKGKYQGTMSIRACSYLDEVVVDKPKVLFSRFRRLGIYRWEDVYRVAKERIDQEIMAFRFSRTEVFNTPIHRDNLQKIWEDETGGNFHIQGPISIPNQRFFRLYQMGTQAQ